MSVRGLVLLTVVVVAAFADATHALPVNARLNVYATCDGDDVVGTHLCFAVKEGIITSVGLQLVDDRTARTGIAVHLVSVDASPPGLPKGATSAVSVTYAFFGGPIEYYDGAQVFLVGAKKVSDIASAILSAVEKRATKLSGAKEGWGNARIRAPLRAITLSNVHPAIKGPPSGHRCGASGLVEKHRRQCLAPLPRAR